MRCKKQKKYFRLEICSLWEVHLDRKLWVRITGASKLHKCSYAWITRYCVFRLVRKKSLFMRQAMKIHSNKVIKKHQSAKKYHRHILCLYGEDEKLLRITAMQLGVTVSHMIRMALEWFLPKIENEIVKWEHIYYHGTKICRYFDLKKRNILKMPFFDQIFYEKWSINEWWSRPKVIISIPYTPSSDDFRKIYGT